MRSLHESDAHSVAQLVVRSLSVCWGLLGLLGYGLAEDVLALEGLPLHPCTMLCYDCLSSCSIGLPLPCYLDNFPRLACQKAFIPDFCRLTNERQILSKL